MCFAVVSYLNCIGWLSGRSLSYVRTKSDSDKTNCTPKMIRIMNVSTGCTA